MEVIYLNKQTKTSLPNNEVYTIGNFDGVHKGHQKLIELTKNIAQNLNSNWGIITFAPNTKSFFNSSHNFLNTLEQKLKFFAKLKVPKVIIIDFNQVHMLTAAQFVSDYLVHSLNIKALVVGSNFKMGKDLVVPTNNTVHLSVINNLSINSSNTNSDLKSYYKTIDSPINEYIYTNNSSFSIPVYSIDINNTSSSNIKSLLQQGNIKEANTLLGYNFTAVATVIHGNKLGRTLGFPTINMLIPKYVQLKHGIYATKTFLPNGEVKHSVSSFGIRPTIENSDKTAILETFIFDFKEDLYEKAVAVEFVDYIREEKKFASLEDLIINIKKDVDKAKSILTKKERNTNNAENL